MNTTDIQKMSIADRLQAMEALWDSLLHSEFELESPPWHGEVLEARMMEIEEGKAEFISIEELKAMRKP